MKQATCNICPHQCVLEKNQTGFCRARKNVRGEIVSDNYGKVTSIALDPIEKKPLRRFFPGTRILSIGSFGCNLRCPYCQNHEISMSNALSTHSDYLAPEKMLSLTLSCISQGNIGLAFTYNEPLIGYEYVRDTARLIRDNNLQTVVVTNAYVLPDVFESLLPYISAFNIDLKSFSEDFYRDISGDLKTVKDNIRLACKKNHVELTTLIIPGKNDDPENIAALARWVSSINPEIALHLTRFYPRYKMSHMNPTKLHTIHELKAEAEKYLKHVYI